MSQQAIGAARDHETWRAANRAGTISCGGTRIRPFGATRIWAHLLVYIRVYSCRAKPDSCRGHLTATNGRDGAETPGEGRGKYKDNETSVGCERDLHATA